MNKNQSTILENTHPRMLCVQLRQAVFLFLCDTKNENRLSFMLTKNAQLQEYLFLKHGKCRYNCYSFIRDYIFGGT